MNEDGFSHRLLEEKSATDGNLLPRTSGQWSCKSATARCNVLKFSKTMEACPVA